MRARSKIEDSPSSVLRTNQRPWKSLSLPTRSHALRARIAWRSLTAELRVAFFTLIVPGCFGLKDDHHHTRVPLHRLTQSHASVSVFHLKRQGLLMPGVSAWLQTPQGGCLIATHEPGKIWIDDQPVVIGTHSHLPLPVLYCPQCRNPRYKLFCVAGRWACYRCHRLTHASRHTNRMLPNWHRLMRLRRKIGAPPVPFTKIASKPSYATRYWRIVAEIRALEAGLVHHVSAGVNDVLERRYDRSRRHGAGDR
jgi:hypothetical protein